MKTNLDDYAELELANPMIIINVKHSFTPDELTKESELLAQAVTDKSAEEANKKAAMGVFKNKIDTLDAEVKLRAGHVTHGFTYLDKPTEMYRDNTTSKRLYFDKVTGNLLKDEPFHPSDFQKKIDFDANEEELRLADIARQQQIEENNRVGNLANGGDGLDALDEVILDKKLGRDRNGNLTDIHPVDEENTGLFDNAEELPE